ncbi:EscG/YscG/SsaH family type III secretion system needle protein co-chaperone, partial [Salmonella enterica]
MESLLKSEVISDDVRRLLLEIMFAGVNHSLISQVHAMLPALTVIVPDKKLQLVCL